MNFGSTIVLRNTQNQEIGTCKSGDTFLGWYSGYRDFNENILGTLVQNELKDTRSSLLVDSIVDPVIPGHPQYPRLYQQNLRLVFFAAAEKCFPDIRFKLGPSLGSSLLIESLNQAIDSNHIKIIQKAMVRLIDSKETISLTWYPYEVAKNLLLEKGNHQAAFLMDYDNEPQVPLVQISDYRELALHPCALSAETMRCFTLQTYPGGLLLSFPSTFDKDPLKWKVDAFSDIPLLSQTYLEHQAWSRILGVPTIGELNRITKSKRIKEYIWTAEALQAEKISTLAKEIAVKHKKLKAVLIAGPSSSGKTTFSKRLGIQLQAFGVSPIALSLDNFFVPRTQTPRDEQGNYDFECIDAIDLKLFNSCLTDLIEGKEVQMPVFDFKLGDRTFSDIPTKLHSNEIMIIEGIHGLNPRLTESLQAKTKFHIYISALTQINCDNTHRISTTDNRLLRRMVRDYRYRGRSAEETLGMWYSVRRGEDKYIFPFQNQADGVFNSALDYELGVLKPQAESLLKEVKPGNPAYTDARRLLELLNLFLPIPREFVPDMSLLREFVGGSAFKY